MRMTPTSLPKRGQENDKIRDLKVDPIKEQQIGTEGILEIEIWSIIKAWMKVLISNKIAEMIKNNKMRL